MTALKRRPAHAGRVAPWAWIAVALAPAGWVLGIALALLSGEGQATGIGAVTVGIVGILLFVAAPAAAVILAVRAARAGHRSAKVAVVVSGVLLVATLVLTLLLGTIALVVVAVVAVAVAAGTLWRHGPPPGPDGGQREGESPAATAPPGAAGRASL